MSRWIFDRDGLDWDELRAERSRTLFKVTTIIEIGGSVAVVNLVRTTRDASTDDHTENRSGGTGSVQPAGTASRPDEQTRTTLCPQISRWNSAVPASLVGITCNQLAGTSSSTFERRTTRRSSPLLKDGVLLPATESPAPPTRSQRPRTPRQ
jgi:hypothetical protein